jgi:hypothetical protein
MPNNPELHRALRSAHRLEREIVVDRVRWLVYELPPPPLDRRSTPSLVFESEGTVRRIRNYPADWRTLGDEALFALSWGV